MAITVNDLAKQVGVPAHVVRYYTRTGLLRPRRAANRYRLYGDGDLVRLRFIRRAKHLGFSLGDIRQILHDADRRRSPCPKTRKIILTRLEENEQRLSTLVALQGRMKRAAKVWSRLPDVVPSGQSICHLIEVVTKNAELDLALT